jgi:murein DD-endopeptidase MepM/ murein hydrolase activator NlpD
MSFVMIATGATSRSRVRTLPVRPLMAAAAVAALVLAGSGGGLGYWLAAPSVPSMPAAPIAASPPGADPFTLEQVGAISGRLFRLESEAAQLSERIVALKRSTPVLSSSKEVRRSDSRSEPGQDAQGPARRSPATSEPPAAAIAPAATPGVATGGPLLPPRPESADLDALEALDAKLDRLERQIAWVAGAATQRSLELMRLPTRLPIAGAELTSPFGNRIDPFAHTHAFHAGLDFAAPLGTPIDSAAGGTVAFAGFKPDFGWVVEIDHGNGLATRYAHASQLLVRTGQIVAPGDRIARVGSTGRSTGPHLHFEVLEAASHVDPRRYLAGL